MNLFWESCFLGLFGTAGFFFACLRQFGALMNPSESLLDSLAEDLD